MMQKNWLLNLLDYAIERITRYMLPMIQEYYERKEGKRELAEWEARQETA